MYIEAIKVLKKISKAIVDCFKIDHTYYIHIVCQLPSQFRFLLVRESFVQLGKHIGHGELPK